MKTVSNSPSIRLATRNDIAAIVDLAEERRRAYQRVQPRFWRKAPESRAIQSEFFFSQLEAKDTIVIVCDEDTSTRGFLVGSVTAAPPVYEPGGLTPVDR
jgi:hypothetical protein